MNVEISRRACIAAVVLAMHVAGFYMFVTGLRSARTPATTPSRPLELYFVAPKIKPVAPSERIPDITRHESSLPITYVAPEIALETPTADWRAAAGEAVALIVDRSRAAKNGQPLDSKPKVIELPNSPKLPKAGDSQRFDDGELITWINERCYVSNRPDPTPRLDTDAIKVFCKDPFAPRTDLFDHLRPDYLGGPNTEAAKRLLADENDCPTLCGR